MYIWHEQFCTYLVNGDVLYIVAWEQGYTFIPMVTALLSSFREYNSQIKTAISFGAESYLQNVACLRRVISISNQIAM